MNAPTRRTAWIKWLLLALLLVGIALGVARALHKRAAQNAAASAAAQALQQAPVFQLQTTDVTTVQTLELDQTVALSGSLRAAPGATDDSATGADRDRTC